MLRFELLGILQSCGGQSFILIRIPSDYITYFLSSYSAKFYRLFSQNAPFQQLLDSQLELRAS